jgi:hypothetical protein
LVAILSTGFLRGSGEGDCPAYPSSKWSFHPQVLAAKADLQSRMTLKLADSIPVPDDAAIPARQNFIDDFIFSRLEAEGAQPANLAGDEEFIRRITIDLTGRPPGVERLRSFLADQSSNKKERLIDELLSSDAFVDRWTFWLGEMLRNTSSYPNISAQGRNALHFYLRDAVRNNMPYNRLVSELIGAGGRRSKAGPPNFVLRSYSAADPLQDTLDDFTANVMGTFLGIPVLCVSCHDGARHLESINTYLAERKRQEFWEQSAFMSRMVISQIPLDTAGRNIDFEIYEKSTGAYVTNTRGNAGQRPQRSGGPYLPVYMLTGERPASENYRGELARILTSDFQFARATANRVWAHLMTVGIVDPVDGFDPEQYQTQASHPELLDALANDFIQNGYNLRQLIRRIATSSTYQLSVHYPGVWRESYRRLYARRLVRPLDAEELHDSIIQATGTFNSYYSYYSVAGFDTPVTWAMQLPDTNEPQFGGTVLTFMRTFGRGNRVDELRNNDSSILGSLSLMNSTFVTEKTAAAFGQTAVARILQLQLTDDELIDQLFMNTLSRRPTAEERRAAVARRSRNRTEWAEDMQWALINKLEFSFNY